MRVSYFGWWIQPNYLTTLALDFGLALRTLSILFEFTLNNLEAPKWSGNNVVNTSLDAQGTTVQAVNAEWQYLGPVVWSRPEHVGMRICTCCSVFVVYECWHFLLG